MLAEARADDSGPRQLISAAAEGTDFLVVTQPTWDALFGWYGGGPAVERPAILVGGGAGKKPKETQLEFTLMHLKM